MSLVEAFGNEIMNEIIQTGTNSSLTTNKQKTISKYSLLADTN